MDEYIKRSDMRAVLEQASISTRFADELPAADVEPVVHAHWVKQDGQIDPGVFCSACGEYEGWTRKRCPNCGAKMDGEATQNG